MNLSFKKNYYILVTVVFVGFLLFGISENVRGPAIPQIQSDFQIGEAQLGLLLALNSLGFLLACMYTSILANKIGIKATTIISFIAMALSGVCLFASTSFPYLTASFFFLYVGNGMLEIALAIIAAQIFKNHTGTMMNLSHFFYGLGSTIAPIMAASLMGWEFGGGELGWRFMYMIVLSLTILPIIPTIIARFSKEEDEGGEEKTSFKKLMKDRIAWTIVILLTFGVTAELATASWLVNYYVHVFQWTIEDASKILSLFFFFFMLARLFLGPVTDKIGYIHSILLFSLFSSVCGIIGIALGNEGAIVIALAGAGIAPIYPTVMALIAKRYAKGTGTAITFTVSLMGIGSVVINLFIGFFIEAINAIADRYELLMGGNIGMQVGFAFIITTPVACVICSFILLRMFKKEGKVV
ncbi:MFS transporter [Alkalihalobacillus hemicellulosilyticus]|uniref:Sucrose permease n=1 Tax=Halalkalibacter hemicellulosilyticusJCM 9152 TaxID=1236971 RepID=W4QJA2_9BACI|nr:MFS transporter [Halalkalibacter hemicellulosilyticus]GAE32200.1 sucrose permease [Halalkalibacter hemicellulosilyticusJCM 9152]